MKAFKVIRDPEAFKLLGDETRRRVIYLLRAKEMTVSQIAAELNLTPQAIYHHIRKMRDAGLVEVAREERVDHFIETYYRATAEVFNFSHGEGMSPADAAARVEETLKALGRIGFRVKADPQSVSEVVGVEKRMNQIDDIDFFVKQKVAHLAGLLSMSDKEFTEYLGLQREHRKILRSLVGEPVKTEVVSPKA